MSQAPLNFNGKRFPEKSSESKSECIFSENKIRPLVSLRPAAVIRKCCFIVFFDSTDCILPSHLVACSVIIVSVDAVIASQFKVEYCTVYPFVNYLAILSI